MRLRWKRGAFETQARGALETQKSWEAETIAVPEMIAVPGTLAVL